jgi:sulfoxide reductase catalytic subunit YedY
MVYNEYKYRVDRGGEAVNRIHPSEITPEHVYLNRRQFMIGAGALLLGGVLGGCAAEAPQPTPAAIPGGTTDELGNPLTPYDSVTTYNNFYEFTLTKEGVAPAAQGFQTSPWQIEVGGLVRRPRTFDLDDLSEFVEEERIYRMRCVEAWSMVIPWNGFPLWKLLDLVEPTAEARYVRFETLLDPERMPGQRQGALDWPYVEGLRLDEARHDLTLLATGLYGKPLPPQNGAPVRLVVPWKYGFKSIKSIVRIDLVAEMPVSAWMAAAAHEYGFYANVNPDVPHPRWSQASERSITDGKRYKTELFNGYGEEVAHLYTGLDLRANT